MFGGLKKNGLQSDLDPVSGGYYVPLADLLTGLVFILVILLTSVTITSRPEFETQIAIEREREHLNKELLRLQKIDRAYVEPRQSVHEALKLILERMHREFSFNGISSEINLEAGVLIIDNKFIFDQDKDNIVVLPGIEKIFSESIKTGIGCFAFDNIENKNACINMPHIKLSRLLLVEHSDDGSVKGLALAAARSAALYGRTMEYWPALASLRDDLGRPVIGHAGMIKDKQRGLRIVVELERPPLPPETWLQED